MRVERALVRLQVDNGLSERRACASLELCRMSVRCRESGEPEINEQLRGELHELSEDKRRYGQPRMSAVMNKRYGVNHKRIERLWKEEHLQLPRRRPKRKRPIDEWIRPREANAPNEVWCYDFVHDRTQYGQKLKMLTVVDEYTRECLEIRAEKQMQSREVLETLDEFYGTRNAEIYEKRQRLGICGAGA